MCDVNIFNVRTYLTYDRYSIKRVRLDLSNVLTTYLFNEHFYTFYVQVNALCENIFNTLKLSV